MSTRRTRVAVIGAGAVGTMAAAAAHDAGHHVVLYARRRPPRLVIERDDTHRHLDIPVIVDPADAQPADWILLTTKAQDTRSAAKAWFDRLLDPHTTVVALQNGVDHHERLQPLMPTATGLVPALVMIAAEVLAPGHVLHRFGGTITVPDTHAGTRFARLLGGSDITVETTADFHTAAWRKLLINAAANPITAVTTQRMGVLQNPSVRHLARALLDEVRAVGVATGAHLTDNDIRHTFHLYDGMAPDDGTSMLYDRLAGRTTEHELITGAVVRLGDTHHVPVPLNRAVLALLRGADHK
ncbi:putative 2-dehydropantoate 2-reductase [Virgisporangium aliadipatigenens]|uniref:2-dehydropantoate 2-reductase n=1 Tax=Virgisporangium aliadipatigenens TaxID=741659 RepID=A0A8J3YKG3_9ACTN|nr:2-dehydropantoate 2-reductase [Virgisporangium aliadipatigenens]GIJ45570.1 putative 2-dehydropantoate 2-reductase [Virgisporangium aliadipatigenens]